MKKLFLYVFLALICFNQITFSQEFKCGFLFSSTKVQLGYNSGFLDGAEYPGYKEKVNSAGWTWAKVREIKTSGDEIFFFETIKNVSSGYIQQVNVFILNTKTLKYEKGIDKGGRSVRIAEYLADKLSGSKGRCKIIE